jgi:hypothetical protein
MHLSILAVFLCIGIFSQAEKPEDQVTERPERPMVATARNSASLEAQTYTSAPPLADGVFSAQAPSNFEFLRTRYRFENDGTGRKEIMARIRILNEAGVQQRSQLTFEYKPFSERLEIPYIRVVKKDGSAVKLVSGQVVERPSVPAKQGVPLFDYDEKRVAVPGLSPGDTLEYEVVTLIQNPIAPGQFWAQHNFQEGGAVAEQFEVDIPMSRAVRMKSKPRLRNWITAKSGRRTYHWVSSILSQGGGQGNGPRWDESPDIQISSFANWEEVGRWYADLEKRQPEPTPELRHKADELTRGLNSDLEKVEALYDFTAKKIKYLSLESLGIAGYEPHSATETLHNQYGDCKDKDTLLAALLEAEGMHSSSVLISTTRKLDPTFPSPWPFTHVITMLPLGLDEIWMDPSAEVLPFRMLVYQLRKRQGLVIPPAGAAYFQETPADSPLQNTWAEDIRGKISDDGTLDATVGITVRGDSELPLRQAFLTLVESARPRAVRGIVKGFSGDISDVTISDPTVTNEAFALSFRIIKPEFILDGEKQSEFRLPLSDFLLRAAEGHGDTEWHSARSEGIRLGPPGKYSYRIRLQSTKRFTAELPTPLVLKMHYGIYEASYEADGHVLTAERQLVILRDQPTRAAAEAYRSFGHRVLTDSDQKLRINFVDDQK